MFKEVIYYQKPIKKYNLTPYIERQEYEDMAEASKDLEKQKNKFLVWLRINKETGERFVRSTNTELLEAL